LSKLHHKNYTRSFLTTATSVTPEIVSPLLLDNSTKWLPLLLDNSTKWLPLSDAEMKSVENITFI
jgi:hypothetical protein